MTWLGRYRMVGVWLLCLAATASAHDYNPFGVDLECKNAYMIDLESGKRIYSKACHEKIFPASTTKMATALLSYQKLRSRLDEQVWIGKQMVGTVSTERKASCEYALPSHWLEFGCSHMGLKAGEAVQVQDLLQGCLVVSANDACNALALTASGSYEAFMQELNAMVRALGCQNSYFMNAHGLYHPRQVSTAHDLVVIARALLQEPHLRQIVAQTSYMRPKTNKQEPALMHNTNLLLRRSSRHFCPAACGVKTGYTKKAGASLVACAQNGARRVLLALSGTEQRSVAFEDAKRLIATALSEKQQEQRFYSAGERLKQTRAVPGASGRLEVLVRDDLKVWVYPSQETSFRATIYWQTLVPPVKRGQNVGKLCLFADDGRRVASSCLLAAQDLEPSILFRLEHWLRGRAGF